MFKLIILSPPVVVPADLPLIASLLKENVFFHIRLKGENALSTKEILEGVDESFYRKIVIHQDYDLARSFNVRGIHLPESERKAYVADGEIHIVSTSVHSIKEFAAVRSQYEYIFYSPVFPSVSKPGYNPSRGLSEVKRELDAMPDKEKLIALGGIKAGNISLVKEAGFGGAAFIGSFWLAENPLKAYSELEMLARGVER